MTAKLFQMPKLYKTDMSPPARAAMMGCEVFGLEVELVEVNLALKEQLKPDYLKKNPIHTVPVLEDNGITMHDSHTILIYLADVYGKDDRWYPKDPKRRALVNQILCFDAGILFQRCCRNTVYPILRQGAKKITEQQYDNIAEGYSFLEEFLSRSKYLAGEDVTIGDISVYSTMTTLIHLVPLDTEKYPKINAWLNTMKEYPFAKNSNSPGAALFGREVNKLLNA